MMSNITGARISESDHIKQSIRDILTTRKGTRIMLREYGSEVPALVDQPYSAALVADIFAESAIALERWEPRIMLEQVYIESMNDQGRIVIGLTGRIRATGERVNFEGIVL